MSALEGKTAVITGASRGLGAGLAEAFREQGLALALCSRSEPALPESADVLSVRLDVRDEKAVEDFAARAVDRFGSLDLWVNNAGVLEPIQPLRDVSAEAFREHIDINLTGLFLCSRAYVRHVHARAGEGVLINISSGAAWHGYEGWSAYCAGKSGVERLTECIHMEEERHGLRAYAVAPGVVDTDMQARIRASSVEDFPELERFKDMKRDDTFNTPGFVAEHLLEIAFDPAHRPDEFAIRIPNEKD